MRILLTYKNGTGSTTTAKLNITKCTNTSQLLALIAKQCKISKICMIVRIKHNQTMLRVINGWDLQTYLFTDGVKVFVQQVSDEHVEFASLDQIEQKSETEEESRKSVEDEWVCYLQDQLEQFHQAIMMKDLQTVAVILKLEPPAKDQIMLDRLLAKKTHYLLHQLDEGGLGSLHWAIQQQDLDIVEFLLIKSCDPNLITLDQYTPLQLAILVRSIHIFDTLINHPRIQVNKVTAKGTALQFALSQNLLQYAQKLIDHGADMDTNEASENSLQQITQSCTIALSTSRPLIPYIVKGQVMALSMFRHKQLLLNVNPFSNSIVIANQKKQIINEFRISDILELNKLSKISWPMKESYSYFELKVNKDSKTVFALQNQSMFQRWLERIHEAYQYVKTANKPIVRKQEQMIEYLNDHNNKITMKRAKCNQLKKSGARTQFLNIQSIEKSEEEKSRQSNETETPSHDSLLKSAVDSDKAWKNDVHRTATDHADRATVNNADLLCQGMRTSLNFKKLSPLICFQDFQFLRQLGHGSFGKVFLARHRSTHKMFALKVLNKKRLMFKKQIKYAVAEASILKRIKNPFIIKLHYSFQTPLNLYMALDYCPHGDLAGLLSEELRLSENGCRFYIAQIIVAIQFLHKNKILYRDLKPDNILIGGNGYIKLADFGLSKENNFATSFCGSPAYLSPEMLNKKGVSFQADLYGIGCVLYEMLVGQPPYYDEDLSKLFDKIKSGKLKYPAFISKPAKSLINSLLNRDISKRLGVQDITQIKTHEFFAGFDWKSLEAYRMAVPAELSNRFSYCPPNLQLIERHGFQDKDYEGPDMLNRIRGYTFVREEQ